MKIRIFIFSVIIVICQPVLPIFAGNTTVNVGIFENKPLCFTDENGEIQGVYPDVIREIARKNDWTIEFQNATWAENLNALEKNRIDLMVSMVYSKERDKIFDFSSEPVVTAWGQVYALKESKILNILYLAGGIAHDFNNILFPILGFSELLLQDLPESSPEHLNVEEIYTSALRAKDLFEQIMTFSRQEKNELKIMKVQTVLKEAMKMIRSTIPTSIDIKKEIDPECSPVKADPIQIHQIIMNLTTNAYHAMEESGGTMTIKHQRCPASETRLV